MAKMPVILSALLCLENIGNGKCAEEVGIGSCHKEEICNIVRALRKELTWNYDMDSAPEDKFVLITRDSDGEVMKAFWRGFSRWLDEDGICIGTPRAWMPLPEPAEDK